MSKLSEQTERIKMVECLKQKISDEINDFIFKGKDFFINNIKSDNIDLDLYFQIGSEVCMFGNIYYFIKQPNVFMNFEMMDGQNDIIIYTISDNTLQSWLHKDFNWCNSWVNRFGTNIPNERDLEVNLMGVFETILYKP